MTEPTWIKVEDELPPVTERFLDGMEFHAEVVGWFPQFMKNKARGTCLWTHESNPDATPPRWMANCADGYAHVRPGPTHWRHHPDPPEE